MYPTSPAGDVREHDDDDEPAANIANSSNDILISHLLDRSPAIPTSSIQTFLDLLRRPSFDSRCVTFESSADIYRYDATQRAALSYHRSRNAVSPRWFPLIVVENIIDHVEAERKELTYDFLARCLEVQDDQARRQMLDPAWTTLANLSLVHRSWTWAAQKAMGRHLVVSYGLSNRISRAIRSPIFGYWTRSAYICSITYPRHYHLEGQIGDDETSPEDEASMESVFFVVELLKRVPQLQHLTVRLDWTYRADSSQSIQYSDVFARIAAMKNLRSLGFMAANRAAPQAFTILLSHTLGQLPRLECLSVDVWKVSSSVEGTPLENDAVLQLQDVKRPPALKRVKLSIGMNIPYEFLGWLLAPAPGATSPLQSLGLSYFIFTHEVDEISFQAITAAMKPTIAFASLRELTLFFMMVPADVNVREILRACTSLRVLRIARWGDIESVIQCVPSTLEELHMFLRLRDDSIASCDDIISTWLLQPTFSTTQQHFRLLRLAITQLVPMGAGAMNPADIPRPSLPKISAACTELKAKSVPDLVLKLDWKGQEWYQNGGQLLQVGINALPGGVLVAQGAEGQIGQAIGQVVQQALV